MENWLDQLEQLIQKKHMLNHAFYQAWAAGKLEKQTLQSYAKEYYHHVKAFPTYLSSLHSHCDDLTTRKCLLSNLMDEEVGNPNHIDLWKTFALALGVEEKELESHKPQSATQELIAHFRSCCSTSLAHGLAALYSYESQIPAICQTKIEGLKKWYGLTAPENYRYFSVHESADIEHSQAEKELLKRHVTPNATPAVLKTAETTLDALSHFLSSFCTTCQ